MVKSKRFGDFDAAASWILGISLAASGIPHLGNPYFFFSSICAYNLVGPVVAQAAAMVLPFLQVILATCLIMRLFRDAAHIITLIILLGFAAIQTSVKARGLDIICGCFGPRHEITIGWGTLSIAYSLVALSLVRNVGSIKLGTAQLES